MTEEQIENEKSRKEYFYISKAETCQFLKTLGASFLGALLALAVFNALHKPPIPRGPQFGPQWGPNKPCPCRIMDRGGRPDKARFHKKGHKFHKCNKHWKGEGKFGNKPVPNGNIKPFPSRPENLNKINIQKPTPAQKN
jgi:hypothetical protein